MGLDPDSDGAREALAGIHNSSPEGLQHFARRVAGPVPNLLDDLARVRAPSLVLVGEHDAAFQRASEVMAARIPRVRRDVLPGAGHVLHLDQPAGFLRAVEEFLDNVDAL